jgi:hypothetical protein
MQTLDRTDYIIDVIHDLVSQGRLIEAKHLAESLKSQKADDVTEAKRSA